MSKFATLDSIKRKENEENGNNESGSNEYYSGAPRGGSGLNVVGQPDQSNANSSDEVQRIMDLARQNFMGGNNPPGSSSEGSFAQGSSSHGNSEGEETFRTVVFYRNGFTVDDGPLRERGTPENDAFIDSVSKGICPPELIDQQTGKPPSLKIADKRSEDYTPPPQPAYVAFSGQGQTLSASSSSSNPSSNSSNGSNSNSNSNTGNNSTSSSTSSDTAIEVGSESSEPTVDESQPSTKIQLRLPSGQRKPVKLNKTHTVRHLLALVEASGEAPAGTRYEILSSIRGPPVAVKKEDLDRSVVDAGLAGAVVIVRQV